ncbi:MAG: hypothetical protein QXY64_00065 [Candidatus Bilamarchaeaceae archaeon]
MRFLVISLIFLFMSITYGQNFSSEDVIKKMYYDNFANTSINDFIIVEGSSLSTTEVAAIEYFKVQYRDFLSYYTPLNDSEKTFDVIESANREKVIVLIGGPTQNKISEKIVSLGWVKEDSKINYYGFIVQNGTTPKGAKIYIVSDNKGYSNLPRKSLEYSPLASFVPREYVPAAATGISFIFLHLLNFFQTIIEEFLGEFAKKEKKNENKNESKIKKYGLELFSFVLASFVLALGITWTFIGLSRSFVFYFILNFIICFFIILVYDGFRWIGAKIIKIPVRYVFWPSGAIITFVSSLLGNPFGLAGVLVEETENIKERWKTGIMNLGASFFTIFVALIFFILNFFFPSEFFQSIFSASSTIAMVSMLPIGSLGGNEVRKWNFFAWFFSFVFISGVYIVITFLIV